MSVLRRWTGTEWEEVGLTTDSIPAAEKGAPLGVATLDADGVLEASQSGTITTLLPGVYNVMDFGAIGDGVADDTAAIQACFDAAAHTGTGVGVGRVFMPAGVYLISSTLQLNKKALIVEGCGIGNLANYAPNPGNGTTIQWGGAAGQPMVRVIDSWWCDFRDIFFWPGATNKPSEGMLFEAPVSAGIGSNAHLKLTRCKFGQVPWGAAAGSFDYCVRIGGASNTNNDEFRIENCILGYGDIAALAVDNSQSVWGTVQNTLFERSAIGLRTSADLTAYNLTFNRNTLDVQTNSSNALVIYGMWSENALKHIELTASGGKVSVYGGKLLFDQEEFADAGGLVSVEHMSCGSSAMVILHGLWFSNATTTSHKIKARGSNSSTSGTLSIHQCIGVSISNLDMAGVATQTLEDAGLILDFVSRTKRRYERLTGNNALDTSLGAHLDFYTATVKTNALTTLAAIAEGLSTVAASGAAQTLNATTASVHDIKLTANCTFTFTAATSQASQFTLVLRQDATGGRTVTWPASIKWAGGSVPTISVAPNATDVYSFVSVDAGVTWLGFVGGKAFS